MMNATIKDAINTLFKTGILTYYEVEQSIRKHRKLDVDDNEVEIARNIADFYMQSKEKESLSVLSKTLGPSALWTDVIRRHHGNIISLCESNDASYVGT